MVDALRARDLHRVFDRRVATVAVQSVDLTVAAGQIVCLLGPNGAGKTTTVKMCSTLLTPTRGSVRVAGVDAVATPRLARRRIGLVLGGDHGFYARATARDNLLFFADVLGVASDRRRGVVERALDAVTLRDRADDRVQAYSRGMRQRLHIARAMLNEPTLMLLDEPTTGLDPEIALEMRALVRGLAQHGTGVLLTTHHMGEAETLADHIVVLLRGAVAVEGTASDIARAAGVSHVTTLSSDRLGPDARVELASIDGVADVAADVRDGRTHLRVAWTRHPRPESVRGVVRTLTGTEIDDLSTRAASLQESYLALVAHGPR